MGIFNESVKMEKEQIGLSLADEFFNFNFIPDHITRLGQAAMKCGYRIQQSIGASAFYSQINAKIRTEKKISLACFYGNAYRCFPAV